MNIVLCCRKTFQPTFQGFGHGVQVIEGERPSCGRWEAGIILPRSSIWSNEAPTVQPLACSIAFAPIRLGRQRDEAVRLDGDENDCCLSTWDSDLVLGTQLLFMSMPKGKTRGRQGYRCFQVQSQASNFLEAAQYDVYSIKKHLSLVRRTPKNVSGIR